MCVCRSSSHRFATQPHKSIIQRQECSTTHHSTARTHTHNSTYTTSHQPTIQVTSLPPQQKVGRMQLSLSILKPVAEAFGLHAYQEVAVRKARVFDCVVNLFS